jgi:hypothetical protein
MPLGKLLIIELEGGVGIDLSEELRLLAALHLLRAAK